MDSLEFVGILFGHFFQSLGLGDVIVELLLVILELFQVVANAFLEFPSGREVPSFRCWDRASL